MQTAHVKTWYLSCWRQPRTQRHVRNVTTVYLGLTLLCAPIMHSMLLGASPYYVHPFLYYMVLCVVSIGWVAVVHAVQRRWRSERIIGTRSSYYGTRVAALSQIFGTGHVSMLCLDGDGSIAVFAAPLEPMIVEWGEYLTDADGDGIDAILGHELAHVAADDLVVRAMTRIEKHTLSIFVFLSLAYLPYVFIFAHDALKEAADATFAWFVIWGVFEIVTAINSRSQEYLADYAVLDRLGPSRARALVAWLQNSNQETSVSESLEERILSSHPSNTARILALEAHL